MLTHKKIYTKYFRKYAFVKKKINITSQPSLIEMVMIAVTHERLYNMCVKSIAELLATSDIETNKKMLEQLKSGNTSLTIAVRYNDVEIAHMLICAGANVNIKNNDGMTPLAIACCRASYCTPIIKLLIDAGANLNIPNNLGSTPLILASGYLGSYSDIKPVKLLIDAGADVNACDNNGSTALIIATLYSNIYRNTETVKLLIDAGANLDIQDNDGWTALMIASRYSNTEIIKLLICAGASLKIKMKDNNTVCKLIVERCVEYLPLLKLACDAELSDMLIS